MRPGRYSELLAVARRVTRQQHEAEDLVQDALLEAVRCSRSPTDTAWLAGVIRNRARMAARSAQRRRRRETHWSSLLAAQPMGEPTDIAALLAALPPALKSVAALALSGHDRREIAYLLGLSDPALRQRVVALKRHLSKAGIAMPSGTPGLRLDLDYGRIRDALLPGLLRQGGVFASHDPDGHLFIVRTSHNRR